MLSLRPRLMLTPTTMEATMAVAMDMELATGGTMVDMALAIGAMDTMESVMLRLSLRPRLMLTPTTMEATMAGAMDMALAIGAMDTMESVMLVLSLRPRLMLTPTTMEATMAVAMDMELVTGGTMVDMALATADTMETMA